MSLKRTADAILEIREASPSHFLIRVDSFSLLGKNGIQKYESGEFSAGGHKWRLVLYTNEGKIGKDSTHISVNLTISDTTSLEVNAIFSIFLLNQISGNYHYKSGGLQRFQAVKSEWGISKFISKKSMMDPSNGFLIDDNCVFGAEVFVLENPAVSEHLSLKKVTEPYERDWKILNFSKLGDKWTSENFVVDDIHWKVEVYPKGLNSGKGRCLSIYLRLIDSIRVKVCFSACIKDQINDKHEKLTIDSHWFSPNLDNWGWPEFMELAIQDPKNGFILNDCCLLEVEISIQAVV